MFIFQQYNGLRYTFDRETGYWRNDATRKRLHVAVWEHHHGPVPEGHEIHHADHIKRHNGIGNLECLTASEHRSRHWREDDGTRLAAARANIAVAAEAAKQWHASPEGREWHRKHAQEVYANRQPVPRICANCAQPFDDWSRDHGSFCSNACKSAARRKSGADDVQRVCACGVQFTASKYSKCLSCSRSCGQRSRHAGNSTPGV